MIKRYYFMSVEKAHNDGSSSYSYNTCTSSYRSFFANPKKARDEMIEYLETIMASKKGGALQIIAFNRI